MRLIKPISLALVALYFSLFTNAQTIKKDTTNAGKYLKRADSLRTQAKYDHAVQNYNKAAQIYKTYKLWKPYIQSQNGNGDALARMGKYKEAIDILKQALQTCKKYQLERSPEVAHSYNNLGIVYHYLDDNELALDYWEKALAIRKEI